MSVHGNNICKLSKTEKAKYPCISEWKDDMQASHIMKYYSVWGYSMVEHVLSMFRDLSGFIPGKNKVMEDLCLVHG